MRSALAGFALAFAFTTFIDAPLSAARAQGADTTRTATAPPAFASPPGVQRAPSSSLANPAISVIGWFQAVAGNDTLAQEEPFEFKEAELAFQAAVDPFTRADVFIAIGHEGVELEEAYLTWLALPGGGQARVGRVRADFGKFNRTHPPETPFADRPLAAEAFLGEEGLVTTGIAASALIPNPADLYWDVVGTVGSVPEEEHPLFMPMSRSDVLAVARTSAFFPLGESADAHAGVSYANAAAHEDLLGEGNHQQLAAADLTFRWKNPRRALYRSLLVQGELMRSIGSADDAEARMGGFGYALWQFARQWKIGARYDWTEAPGADGHASGVLALIQYQPSEFSQMSVQARRIREGGEARDAVFFKWIFNIGPHGGHPY